jgi:hypothetical protein
MFQKLSVLCYHSIYIIFEIIIDDIVTNIELNIFSLIVVTGCKNTFIMLDNILCSGWLVFLSCSLVLLFFYFSTSQQLHFYCIEHPYRILSSSSRPSRRSSSLSSSSRSRRDFRDTMSFFRLILYWWNRIFFSSTARCYTRCPERSRDSFVY